MTETKPPPHAFLAIDQIAKSDSPVGLRAFNYPPDHPAMALWLDPVQGILVRIAAQMARLGASPVRTLVLLPYAQLLPLANRLWAQVYPDGFAPRFETTQNWVSTAGGVGREPTDITFDSALDTLTAQALLQRGGMQAQDGLAPLLVQAAQQLAPLAAAAGPAQRAAWAQTARPQAVLGMEGDALAWEAQVARLAVEWAAVSGYASDALFAPEVAGGLDCLVLVEGLAATPLAAGLLPVWGDKLVCLPLSVPDEDPAALPIGTQLALHACLDSEDEAQRTAACALRHIAADRYPLALVSSDRALTRRVRAMLELAGVQMRDENGWKLSTSRAAAAVMGLLKAAQWNAKADVVLACMKQAPAFATQTDALEAALRRDQVRDWRHAATAPAVRKSTLATEACAAMEPVRSLLSERKSLQAWLVALQQALQAVQLWDVVAQDVAGAKVLAALRLAPEEPAAWQALLDGALWAQRRLDLAEFTAWANQALEGASFQPPYPVEEQLVILPMSQMLARPFAAVVLAGCDEVRLNPSPEPVGGWTPAQRIALGMPAREALEQQLRAAWQHALQSPVCDVLWRTSDDAGESLLPSALVQLLQADLAGDSAGVDPREDRAVQPQPSQAPQPQGDRLPVQKLSASAYDDMRQCPYRFFALRQLGLKSVDELESEVDKRDFGVWLHAVLQHFHNELAAAPTALRALRQALLDQASAQATADMALPEGEFLPFAASWPAVREGYLDWLEKHEAGGAVFASGETSHQQPLGDITLIGRIDRMDTLPDGSVMVLDYKTEPGAKTKQRVKEPLEDTQIAFYAALLPDDSLRAAYVNVGERDGTVDSEQPEVVAARDALVHGILDDMRRIAQGAAMPALGEGVACDYCQARGLCRKDFWEAV